MEKQKISSKRIPAHPLGIFCAAHRPVNLQDLFGVLIPESPVPSTEIQKRTVGIMSFSFCSHRTTPGIYLFSIHLLNFQIFFL